MTIPVQIEGHAVGTVAAGALSGAGQVSELTVESASTQLESGVLDGIAPNAQINLPEGSLAQEVVDQFNQRQVDALLGLLPDADGVSLDSAEQIANARQAYEALSDSQKALAQDQGALQSLEQAEAKLAELEQAASGGQGGNDDQGGETGDAGDNGGNGQGGDNGDNGDNGQGGDTNQGDSTGDNPGNTGSDTDQEPVAGQTLALGTGATKANYQVTKAAGSGQGQVTYAEALTGTASTAAVPDTIAIAGKTYKVTAIKANAFAGKASLTSIRIGKYVRSIPASAFTGCKKLKKVTGGASVVSIGSKAFKGLTKLTTVPAFPKLTTIGTSAFQGCKALKAFSLGKSAKKIGKKAFYGCKKLKKLTIKSKKLKSIGKSAFKKTPSSIKVKMPKAKKKAYLKMLRKAGLSQKTVKRLTVSAS